MSEPINIPTGLIASQFLNNNQFSAAAIGDQAHFANSSSVIDVSTPITGEVIAQIGIANSEHLEKAITQGNATFEQWRLVPAPVRGQLVAMIGQIAREKKEHLAQLITIEMGKIYQEALGEVQEWIDMCDFAVGLSRQLYGLTIASERADHRMMEQWHPLGTIGIITAFNFPMAVWAWNAMLGLICGNTLLWKPSEKTPLCALACHQVVLDALEQLGEPFKPFKKGLSSVLIGEAEIGQQLTSDKRLPLISATGSVAMGKKVAATVGARLGRSLLELGGNNAAIIAPSAQLDLTLTGVAFAAAGTCGQRCTTLRRLIVHDSIYDTVKHSLINAFKQITIGDPRDERYLMGPIIDQQAYEAMQNALQQAEQEGGTHLFGGDRIQPGNPTSSDINSASNSFYITPAFIEIDAAASVVQQETFAPILYLHRYQTLSEAIAIQNRVPQGLSSSIFTRDMQEAELFLSAAGSDCGLANVNIGTSGAEIGGAFGGEKETGGGRESGSDSWKNYMRRSTNTINYGSSLPLAQGVKFDIKIED